MSAHEAPAEGGVPSDMLPASDSLTNAVTTTTTAATEGVPPSMPTPLPAVVPPTMQFHCAFSSLRGCRRTQEDSAMIVNDLRVRLRRRAAAEPITANAPTPVTEAPGGVGAPSDTEAAGEGTEQADATQSTTRQKEAGPHHIVDAHADVVFQCVGVFDGHCGDGVASFASKFFQEHFEHALQDLQEQVEPDQQEGGGAMRVTRSSTSFREEPVKRPHRDHHEISLADAVHFQRAVSASLVQALMHLDLTCYNLLHNSTRGRPAQCRDAGSTASVAVFFKAPLATALRHSDVSGGISRSSNGTPLLATSDTVERFNGGGLATTCTPAASDGESRRRTGCDEVVPLSPIPTTCVEDTYRLCLANLGDSRAIIGRLDTGILLLSTTDHRISACPTERARIQAAGGVVEFDRIGGSLDVTRGLGDYRYKVAPAQWWASAATSSSTDAPEGFSSMPTGVEGRRTASTTSAMSSSKFEVVEGLVPPASTLRCGDAPAAGDSMMGTLRWQSGSNTPLRSPMSEDADGCEAAIVNLQRGARHVRGAVGEARTVSVTSSCGSHPPGAAEGAANAPVRPQQQQLPQSPLSPLSPPLPSSAEVLTSNAVSNIADVYEWEVHRGEVLIIASDGVWDRMNSEDVLAFVCSALAAARRQPKAPSTGVMSGEEASGDPSNVAGGEGRGLSVFDGVDAQVSSAADVTPLSFGGALACGPLRHPSPCCERRATSSHCSRGAAFCTPGGNEDVGCNEVHSAVASLPGPTGSGLNFSIVQAAARRLTEYVLHNLSGTDNTSAVVVVFH
ncbi:hypothetical protein JKF63_07158 [Porcisia hertigi]|uniref:protein-serine/threonine phosphatase n=1 Tax=Porcisia hertigi TaxID=2761500 RepID=A0A837A943_9TRYP|nr:hypothetical protein JKF63_07158 [Porcisia hertigi]